jgi:hypothetical protein
MNEEYCSTCEETANRARLMMESIDQWLALEDRQEAASKAEGLLIRLQGALAEMSGSA